MLKAKKNPHAAALGRLGKGLPKSLTPEQRAALSARAHALNAARRGKVIGPRGPYKKRKP